MCNAFGYPASIKRLLCKPTEDIITYGNQVLRGLVNNNQGCRNYYDMHRIQYIIQYSIAYTIARKCDISLKKVFKKYHSQLIYSYTNDKGKDKTIKLALHSSFKRDKTFFSQWLSKIKQDVEYRYRDTNPLKRNCYICGNPQHHVMFHRRRISSLHMPYSHIIKEMIRINRRQICLCRECFIKVSQNLLEYNQIAKRKLTQKWRAVCIERCPYGSGRGEVFQTSPISQLNIANYKFKPLFSYCKYNQIKK